MMSTDTPATREQMAADLFRGKDKLNCVEAMLTAFADAYEVTEADMVAAARLGGGKAPGGVCGALHAVRMLVSDPATMARIEHGFAQEAGSLNCKVIRKQRSFDCRACVGLAARLLNREIGLTAEDTE